MLKMITFLRGILRVFGVNYSRKYFLILGDTGVMCLYVRDNVLISSLYVSDDDTSELDVLLDKDKRAKILIVLDHADMSFSVHSLPAIGFLGIHQIINKKMRREYKSFDLQGAIKIGVSEEKKRHFDYGFVLSKVSGRLEKWTNYVLERDNNFAGFTVASLEYARIFVDMLTKATDGSNNDKMKWHIVVVHVKGAFRQIALKNKKMIFTRLIHIFNEDENTSISEKIYEEIQNSVQYLGRFGYTKDDILNVHIIASEEWLEKIDHKSKGDIICLTPEEVAKKIGIRLPELIEDRCCENLLGCYLINRGEKLCLKYKRARSILAYQRSEIWGNVISRIGMICSLIGVGYGSHTLYSEVLRGEMLSEKIQDVQSRQDLFAGSVKYDLKEIRDMESVVELHKMLISRNIDPLHYIHEFYKNQWKDVFFTEISWQHLSMRDQKLKMINEKMVNDILRKSGDKKFVSHRGDYCYLRVKLSMLGQSKENFSVFKRHEFVDTEFKGLFGNDYVVFVSPLPATISLDSGDNKMVPISVDIIGKV